MDRDDIDPLSTPPSGSNARSLRSQRSSMRSSLDRPRVSQVDPTTTDTPNIENQRTSISGSSARSVRFGSMGSVHSDDGKPEIPFRIALPPARDLGTVVELETPAEEKNEPDFGKDEKRKSGVTWTVNPFDPDSEKSQNDLEDGPWNQNRGSRVFVERSLRRGSTAAVEVMRRGSAAAVGALSHVNVLREVGNPLELKVNEVRRVSQASFPDPFNFDGRNSKTYEVLGRRPSLFPKDADLVKRRSDDDPNDYSIQRIAAHDDIDHMNKVQRWIYMTTPFWAALSLLSYWGYFALRIRFTIDAQHQANEIFWMAWVFIAVEIGVAIPMVMHRTWSMMMMRGRRRPKLRLIGNSVPSVDVLVTCCGEEDSLVLDTAMAACNVDYPSDRFRVLILDDGASAGLKELVESRQRHSFENMYYLSRPKFPGVPHHFKAGNLNYALKETENMPGGAANFVAALDADMIPEKSWLRALLPHMLQDLNCSMACPPQQFYNVPKDDPLCQSLDTFIHISEPIKDTLGVAWCTGSGYIMRRDALDSIGWFPLGSLAEDVCTSSMFLGAGWNTAFVHEPLQFGTVPESLSGHLKQRTRWTIGTVQTSLKLNFCLFGPLVKHMSALQRASGFVYTVSSLFTIFLVLSLFTCPIVLYSGGNMVPYATMDQLKLLSRFCFITMFLNRVNEFVVYIPSGYFVGQRDARGMMWMAPYHALSVFQSFILPKWMGGKIAVFTSSGSQSSELNERDVNLRAGLWRRLRVTLFDCKAWIHLVYIIFVLGSIGLSCYYCYASVNNQTTKDYVLYILTHCGWPPILWLVCVVSCWAPIQYAICPPTVPDREDLLVREPETGVAYPSEEARKVKQTSWHLLHEFQYSLICIYTTVVFVYSFWM